MFESADLSTTQPGQAEWANDWIDDEEGHHDPDGRNAGVGRVESMVTLAAAIGATLLTRKLLAGGWRQAVDRDPPKNPASPEVSWREALLWGAVSGAVIGVVRIASRRASSKAYRLYW